ncbi:MAG: hypothetical protein DCC65_14760 [Planctomycetota bacterium]|nr:MAG: hypothetical protein DCC65_14760 [Planctomycetota bacterium]
MHRTILLCPLFSRDGDVDSRLGPEGEVLYSSLDGRTNHALGDLFRFVQQKYHVELVYGRRMMRDPLTGTIERPEVVLIDVSRAAPEHVNGLKFKLYERFGIVSTRYEGSWEYEQWVRLAEPGLAAIRAILGSGVGHPGCIIVAHEFMGLPTALAAKLHPEWNMRTVYHAHEVPTVRKIVEEHAGHDTMFYRVLDRGMAEGKHLPDIFGDYSGYFRHALAEASRHLDVTLAVSELVAKELRFLSPAMADSNIRVAYNGIPAYENAGEEAAESKARLQEYAETLLGERPDYVFTHVTRMTPSKGLWRDLAVMKYIEDDFRRNELTAVLFVLSTEIGGPRRGEDVRHMERWWDWPVAHREAMPDLTGGEALYYSGVQSFNARSRNCKVVFINQFGFDRASCGERMPREMRFWDIRKGSDVEFGQSIYEPFGIAQIEALSFGSLCVMSSACGCAGFVCQVAGRGGTPNVIAGDYAAYRPYPDTIERYLKITREEREAFEEETASRIAAEVLRRLPRSKLEKAAYVRRGYELADQMSWSAVAEKFILPAFREISAGSAGQAAGAA